MGSERRIHPRTDTRLEATLSCAAGTIDGLVENVGAGGVFFATENLEVVVEEGGACTVAFSAPSAEVSQPGQVLRCERYFDGSKVIRAFAIKFDGQLDVASLGLGA